MKLSNLALKSKLIMCMAIPIIAVCYFALNNMSTYSERKDHAEVMNEMVEATAYIGQLVHKLQKERGMTSAFLQSNGQARGSELASTRLEVDARIEALDTFISGMDLETGLDRAIRSIMGDMSRIGSHRMAISSLSLKTVDAMAYYSELTEDLIQVVGMMSKLSPSPEIALAMTAFMNYMAIMDYSGIERAILTQVFSRDMFDEGEYELVVALIAKQDVYENVFLSVATAEQRAFYEKTMNNPSVGEVGRLQEAAITGMTAMDPKYWLQIQTDKRRLMTGIEEVLADDVTSLAGDVYSDAVMGLYMALFVSIAGIVVSFVFATWVIRETLVQLGADPRDLLSIVEKVAGGDLHYSHDATGSHKKQGAFGEMEDMREKLAKLIGNAKAATNVVKEIAEEMSEGNRGLSERTEQQAANVEQTAASMEEMTSTVKQNAENAADANELANKTGESADQGGQVVSQAVDAMKEIDASSEKIAAIINVIDDIAFQTNLLAINAAVEAARAGDQGRGFAVVANEVRNLAGRSATAAKEIKELIEDSVQKVKEGTRLVNETGDSLEHIVGAVKQVSSIVSDIAVASREQALGIEQTNDALTQLDSVTQQNAALAEEAAATSEAIYRKSNTLADIMSFFDVDADEEQPQSNGIQKPSRSVADDTRRSEARPWSGAKPESNVKPIQKAAAGGSDDEWESF